MTALPATASGKAVTTVSRSISRLLRTHPFFGSLALRLPIQSDGSIETIATDGVSLYINPQWAQETETWHLDTAVARIVYACTLKHHTRRRSRDPEIWQLASQLVTHDMLDESGFRLPPGAESLSGHSVESAYEKILRDNPPTPAPQPQPQPEPQPSDQADPSDDSAGDPNNAATDSTDTSPAPENPADQSASQSDNQPSAGDPSPATPGPESSPPAGAQPNPDTDSQRGQASDTPDTTPDRPARSGDSGSPCEPTAENPNQDATGATGQPDPRVQQKQQERQSAGKDPSGTGCVLDSPPQSPSSGSKPDNSGLTPTPEQIRSHEQHWDKSAHQSAAFATAQGNFPTSLTEQIRSLHNTKLDWRALLREYATEARDDDYSWSHPSRRFLGENLYLPGPHSEDDIQSIVVVIDTSSSIKSEVLQRIWSEIHAYANDYETEEIRVIQVDYLIRENVTYHHLDLPLEIDIKGRRRTDFRPAFAWLASQKIKPVALIYLTDLICDKYPDKHPKYPVIWLNWHPPLLERRRPPFGKVIDVV